MREYGIELVSRDELTDLDAVVLAVPHAGLDALTLDLVREGAGILADVLGVVARDELPDGIRAWSL